ncbi:MAG TPA: hypothetical protein VHF69_14815 [Candidatus Synoicihabitans sp.]|nr:hypothetical protein [Candidatus Synoicihabitans sp.]
MKRKCRKVGMNGYLSKPLRQAELNAALEDVIPAEAARSLVSSV